MTDLLTLVHSFLTDQHTSTLADLHEAQRLSNYGYPPFRCPNCKARLFDGWLFGTIRCGRCGRHVLGRLDKFVEVLQNYAVTNERL